MFYSVQYMVIVSIIVKIKYYMKDLKYKKRI